MNWNFRNREQAIFLAAVVFFFVASSIIRYIALAQTPYANGWDGYYYVMQAHSWLTYGNLQSPDYSIIYPYFILLSKLIGDYELAYKVGAALISGGLLISSFSLVYALSGKIHAAILTISFLLFSPTITFFISQFPKNALAVIVLNLLIISIYKKNHLSGITLFALSLLTHRMIAGLSIIIILLAVINTINKKWIMGALVIIFTFSLLPGILHISDFTRFYGQFNWTPQLSTFSFYKLFENGISFWWAIELILLSLMIIHLTYAYIKTRDFKSRNPIYSKILPVISLIAIFPFFTMAFGSMGYRFFMLTPLIVSVYFVSKIQPNRTYSLIIALLFVVSSAFSFTSYNPYLHDPPNKLYDLIINRLNENYNSNEYPLVIAHKSLAELIIYRTDFDALNWSPPKTANPDSVLRIIHNIEYYHFSKYLFKKEVGFVKKLTMHYYAVPESSWKKFLKLVKEKEDYKLMELIKSGNNPLEQRPQYLKKGKSL
jgi:hypothetical protein